VKLSAEHVYHLPVDTREPLNLVTLGALCGISAVTPADFVEITVDSRRARDGHGFDSPDVGAEAARATFTPPGLRRASRHNQLGRLLVPRRVPRLVRTDRPIISGGVGKSRGGRVTRSSDVRPRRR